MTIPLYNGSNAFELLTYPQTVLDSIGFSVPDAWYIMILCILWVVGTTFIFAHPRVSVIEEAALASTFLTIVVTVILISATSMNSGIAAIFIALLSILTAIIYSRKN